MTEPAKPPLSGFPSPMTDKDFARLSTFIERELGIKMPPAKRVMLESRLSRRLRQHGFSTYAAYADYVFSEEGARVELIHMIDAVTTNKTDFFREADHFDFLLNTVLANMHPGNASPFKIWSAGCSTGEEPYTIAMVVEEYRRVNPSFHYSILATDISTKVLGTAMEAVYADEKVVPVPIDYKKRYFLRSKDPEKHVVKVKSELRSMISFQRLNFMDEDFGLNERFDVIFCRNVIIYFDRPTQERLIRKFYDHLRPQGFLFLGHSETMTGMDIPFHILAPTVYQRD